MRIIIDGYNLIRRVPELENLERADIQEAREALVRELSVYRAGKRHQIVVVFDGLEAAHLGGSSSKERGISVRFSPRGNTADRVILDAMKNREADVLVSADRELTDAARRSDVTPVSPGMFWDRVLGEMYRQVKGEEFGEEVPSARGPGGRRLSKARRKDWARIEKL